MVCIPKCVEGNWFFFITLVQIGLLLSMVLTTNTTNIILLRKRLVSIGYQLFWLFTGNLLTFMFIENSVQWINLLFINIIRNSFVKYILVCFKFFINQFNVSFDRKSLFFMIYSRILVCIFPTAFNLLFH